jgi:adenylate cyclase
MLAKLIVTNDDTGRRFEVELANAETRIGRALDRNEVVLNDGQVSREHAVVRRAGNAFMLVDLGSANGVFINGERVNERILKDGDLFTISHYTLRLEDLTSKFSIKYSNQQVGNTVLFRTPGVIAPVVPQIDRASLPPGAASSDMVFDYLEVLKKKAETLAVIYELNKLLSSAFSQDDIFKKVIEMLFRFTPADRIFVLLKEASGELSTQIAQFKNAQSRPSTGEIIISKTVVDRVLAERVSLLSFDAQADERLLNAKSILMHSIRSVMCAPLLGQSGVLGVILVDCQEPGKTLKEDDLELLNAIAAETSIAVDNAISHKRLVREELARAKYRRFMPPFVVDEILANPDAINLGGGKNSQVTVLFSDVRAFTSMSETLEPNIVVEMLNKYFGDMTPIVFENRGLLDKYIGDGLMALFGAPNETEDAALNAVRAAVEMQHRMLMVNADLKEAGLSEIAIGIGINTGTVTLGYIGSEERTDYTAIGDAVNLAARLEKQALGWQIIISRSTLNLIGDKFPVRPSGSIMVKGKKSSVEIYEVLWKETSHPSRPTHF